MIGHARVELARSARIGDLGGAAAWGTSNRQARHALLGLLASTTNGSDGRRPGVRGGSAGPDGGGQRRAREALLRSLPAGLTDWVAAAWWSGVVQLAPTAEDQRQAREALLGLLAGRRPGGRTAGEQGWSSSPRRRRTSAGPARRCSGCWPASQCSVAAGLVDGVVQLAPTAEDKRQAREALLGLLAGQTTATWPPCGGERSGPARPDGARTSARPARCCSGCWPARPTATWPKSWWTGWSSSPRGGGPAPGPRGAARAAGRRGRRLPGRRAGGRGGPARPDGGGQAARPARCCSGCWPAKADAPTWPEAGGLGGPARPRRRRTSDRSREALLGFLAGERRRMVGELVDGLVQLAARRRTRTRPVRRCSGYWPARPTAWRVANW